FRSGVQHNALQELTEVLNKMLSGQGAKRSKMGGPRTTAEILNYMSSVNEEAIVDNLRDMDNDLTERIVEEMFVFENLIDIEDMAIQLILQVIETSALAIELKGATDEFRVQVFHNMYSLD